MKFSVQKALEHQVIYLGGEEEFLRRQGLAEIMKALDVDADDGFDVETFDASNTLPMNWIASCGTAPFLGERRIAVVRHVLRTDLTDYDPAQLQGLPKTALLILVADDEPREDEKKGIKATKASWPKIVAKAGGLVEKFDVTSSDLRMHLKDMATAGGTTLSDAAMDALLEMTAGSLSRAGEELEKLMIYTQGRNQIKEADVKDVAVPSREWNVFKLVDSVVTGQVAEALRQLRVLVGSQDKAESAAMRAIFPQASRNLKLMYQAKLCLEARCGPDNAPESVLARFPDRPNLATEKPFVQTKVMNMARKVSYDQIEEGLRIIANTDGRLKGLQEGFSPMDSLERMVMELVEVFQKRSTVRPA